MVNRRHDEDRHTTSNPGTDSIGGSPVDLAALDRATGGDTALQREVVQMFVEQVTAKLEIIRRSVAERDADGLRRASHTLLGSCTTLGAAGMADLLSRLELLAGSTSFEGAQELCADLASEAERTLRFLGRAVLSSL